jgi:hypothetical protein
VQFLLLGPIAWKLTRHSYDLNLGAVMLLCVLAQAIFLFGFASERLEAIGAAALFDYWVNWLFLGYVGELDRTERIAISICCPVIGLIAVFAVHLAVN